MKQDPANIGPPCECHGVPTRLVPDKRYVNRYPRCRVKMREAQKRHQSTEKGLETHRRYRGTEKSRESLRRYNESTKGELRTYRYRRTVRLPKERERIAEEIRRLEEEQDG